jgi:hypothetical protein
VPFTELATDLRVEPAHTPSLAQGSGFVKLAALGIFDRKQEQAGGPWQREDLRQFGEAEFPRNRLGNERP